jgi:hypothetical protein
MFSASRYPGIRLEALEGYTEDKRSKRQFLLPYSVLAVAAIIVLLSIFTRHAIHKSAMSLGWFFVGGLCFVVILGAIALAYRSVPKSTRTGRPMKCYRNLSAPEGVIELLYVDEDSRTFFRNIYAVPE